MLRWSAVLLAFASTVALSQEPAPKPLTDTCPGLTAGERAEIEKAEHDRSVFRELTYYSRTYCVSLGEARRRMDIQNRGAIGPETEPGGLPPPPPDSIGSIAQAIEANEATTFAGLWIEHRPRYQVTVAFTRDAAETLRKYTGDPLFVPLVRPGPSQAQLRAVQDRLFQDLQRLGARPASASADVKAGRVEFEVLGDLAPFRAAVARGEVELPTYVDIREPAPLARPAPPLPADWRQTVRAFPRARFRSGGIELAILRTGKVVLEGGCLRLKGERRSRVIVWPNEAALDLSGPPGTVRILNRMSGETIEPGKTANLGGNAGELTDDANVVDADPACPGPYFQLGNFSPMDRFEEGRINGRASEIEQERRVARAEALRLAREEQQREDRLRDLGEVMLREAPDAFAGVNAWQGRATIRFAGEGRAQLERLVPDDLRRFVLWEPAQRPLAALRAEKNRFLDQVEALGIEATAYEDVEQGRIVVNAKDLLALGRAAEGGHVTIPAGAQVQTDGAMPEGEYGAARLEALNRALEAVPDWSRIRALVEATKLPGFLVTYKEGEPDRPPTRAQSLEITRFLISLGYTADDLQALHAEGLFPARAYVEQNGRATLANRALLAQEAIVAEIVDVKPELLGDGFRSTARIRVVEGLKGDLTPGEEAWVRLVSGPGSDGRHHQANDEPLLVSGLPMSLQPGTRWLMLLSEGMHARHASLLGKAVARPAGGRTFAPIYGAWQVRDEAVAASYSEPSPGPLAAVRAQLAPVDAAFDRAARRRGAPLQRRAVP